MFRSWSQVTKRLNPSPRVAFCLRRSRNITSDANDTCAERVALGPIGPPSKDFAYRLKRGIALLNHG